MPRANTGSWFLNLVSDTNMFLVQMERRVDHWLRPTFDAILRDPIARLVTGLINMQRRDEGLKIAEEKLIEEMPLKKDALLDAVSPGGPRGMIPASFGASLGVFSIHPVIPIRVRDGI